jgi:uncharacterized GH25 family protein
MRPRLGLLLALVLALPAAGLDLQGCIYLPDGTIASEARVTAGILDQAPIASATASEGCFTFTNLPDALLSLTVEAEGLPAKSLLALPGDLPLTIALSAPVKVISRFDPAPQPISNLKPERDGGTISGVVRIETKPLAGAPVLLHPMSNDPAAVPWRVVTDAKGRFEVRGLPLQRYVVTIADGYPSRLRLADAARMYEEGSEPAVADLTRERAKSIEIALVKPPVVAGRIVDADDKPVRGARVQIILAGRPSIDFMHEGFVRTDADGRYAIVAPPFGPTDQAVAVARPLRSASTRSKPFFIRNADVRADMKLPKFEPVTVRVLDAEKKPVANARVAFGSAEETGGMPDASYLLALPWANDASRTGANGEVTLHLTPGSYDFAADAENFQLRTISDRAIPRATTIDIALEPAFAIRGRVHRNGAGVPNVQIALGESHRRDTATITDAQGRFAFEGLARGTYRLNAVKYEELVQQSVDAKAPSDIEIALDPAGTLELRVTDADTRQPVRAFVFSVSAVNEELVAMPEQRKLDREASTDEGIVRLTLPTGVYRVTVHASGYTVAQPSDFRVSDREPAVIDVLLERGRSVSGRVVDETSAPVEGADVFVMQRSKGRVGPATARTGADGSFTVSGLQESELSLTIRKEGFVTYRQTLSAEPGLAPLDVRLSRGLTLEGVVTRGGKPVAEAQVGATTSALDAMHQPATTDANGRFTLRGLIAARYTVTAYKDEAHAEVRDVDPSKQKELSISLDDRPRGILFGTVTGLPSNGGKIVRRSVFVSSDENGAESTIDDNGSYRIENAPTGTVYVTAHVESTVGGTSTARRKVVLTAGQPQRVDLDLGGTVRVSGRVLLDGRPVAGARVTFASYESEGAMASSIARADGAYELTLATPGRYRIFAFAEGTTDRQFSAIRDIRGGESIDLDLREQVLEGTVVDASTRQPIAEALVTLMPVGIASTSVAAEMQTDALGRFRIATAGSGAHQVIASAPGYGHRTTTLNLGASPAPMTFELSPVSQLRVRILDARTETPLDGHVWIANLDGSYVPVRADRSTDGATHLFSVAPGKYRVSANVFGYEQQSIEVTAPGDADLRLK